MMKDKAVKNRQRYEKYKESGVEWLGEIPEHWETRKIKFFYKNTDSIFIDGDWIESKDIGSNEVYYFTTGNIRELKFYDKERTFISNKTFAKLNCTEIFENDILISRLNLPIGRCCLAPKFDKKTIVSVDVCVLRSDKEFNRSFLVYVMNSPQYFTHTENEARGAIMKRISRTILGNISLPIPPLPEQTAIAQFLDDKTNKIDDAIAIKAQQIALLKERKQILIHKAVTRGLDDSVTLKDSGVDWIGEIPVGWEVKPIKYLGNIINGYAFNSGEFKDEGVRVMKISNIQTMRIDWTDESFIDYKYYHSLPQFRINKNDLVFALTRPIISTGIKASIVDTAEKILLNQRNAVLKPSKKLFKKWIYFVILDTLFTQSFDREIDKTGQQPNISTSSIGNIKIPFPCLEEQKEISAYIETASRNIETAIGLKQQEIAKLKEYKSSLINGVATGKVRVC